MCDRESDKRHNGHMIVCFPDISRATHIYNYSYRNSMEPSDAKTLQNEWEMNSDMFMVDPCSCNSLTSFLHLHSIIYLLPLFPNTPFPPFSLYFHDCLGLAHIRSSKNRGIGRVLAEGELAHRAGSTGQQRTRLQMCLVAIVRCRHPRGMSISIIRRFVTSQGTSTPTDVAETGQLYWTGCVPRFARGGGE